MRIKKIKLINFRNYKNQTIDLNDGLNVLVGENAQGKTNLIEAIYFSCIGKSPRTKKENELINWQAENAKIEIELEKKEGSKLIEVFLNKKGKKNIKINGINILRIGELIGTLNCVFFAPDELKLVKDSPQDRRRFMDIDLSQLSKNYFYLINTYNKILAERNKLLKDTKSFDTLKQTIYIWDKQLADVGSKIIIRRIRFLNALKVYANKTHQELTSNKENLELFYEGIVEKTTEEIKQKLLKEYEINLEKDFRLGFTNIGPHRDDISILTNGIDVKSFGSQGQQRTVALSLKLAELEIFASERGEYPILLLDDVLSELDDERKNKLLNKTKTVQTLITTTNFNYKQKANILKVKEGTITSQKE
ncbi:MAG: DNA replication/repair protein RecF [Clostridia bacterium]|nr:DNA replication/repair protein RecF [Clostridia bacterium]